MQRFLSLFQRQRALAPVTNGVFAPLLQAERCLDAWLLEERRSMTQRQRHRATALIARYFEHEDSVSDQLILSFLHHYSGMGVVDLEDPHAVRIELKTVLDRSVAIVSTENTGKLRLIAAACTGMLAMASVLIVFYLSQQTLTMQEQQELRTAVAIQAEARGTSSVTIWTKVKRDLGVARYQDIRRWDFDRALKKANHASGF